MDDNNPPSDAESLYGLSDGSDILSRADFSSPADEYLAAFAGLDRPFLYHYKVAGDGVETQLFTRGQFLELARRGASCLISHGVEKGDRVALLLPNSPPYIIGYYAILNVGAIVVNLNPLSVERELLYLLNHAEARTIIVAEPLFPRITCIAPRSSLRSILVACLTEWAGADRFSGGKRVAGSPRKSKGVFSLESLIEKQYINYIL